MIGSLLIGAAKFAWGCIKVGFKATKVAIKLGRKLARQAKRTYRTSKKLSVGVMKVVRQSRAVAKNALQQNPNVPKELTQESNIFTKPKK